jgi:hypothetical protein
VLQPQPDFCAAALPPEEELLEVLLPDQPVHERDDGKQKLPSEFPLPSLTGKQSSPAAQLSAVEQDWPVHTEAPLLSRMHVPPLPQLVPPHAPHSVPVGEPLEEDVDEDVDDEEDELDDEELDDDEPPPHSTTHCVGHAVSQMQLTNAL